MSIRKCLLCFAPKYNTPGRRDATGAFQPEALKFLKHHDQHRSMLVLIDNKKTKAQMRAQVLAAITSCGSATLDGVFWFCHGFRRGIQFGFGVSHLKHLVKAIRTATQSKYTIVTFYSCDVGRDADRDRQDDLSNVIGGDGGFCDEFRDALCREGSVQCRVDGHTTRGHTTRNPFVRRFEGGNSRTGGMGGYYLVPRSNKKLWPKWRAALKGTMRFEYPFLEAANIIAQLSSK